ncbi:MAG: GGDEF domain-containing protein [Lachnospiraceae bacterium]|nr:GGDEF domain-containing protein [Lachnospiraceae bacterium]
MRKKMVLILPACFAVLITLLVIMLGVMGNAVHYPYRILYDGWRLRGSIAGAGGKVEHLENESITIDEVPVGRRGDYFQISAKLPDMGDIPFPTLMFETRYSAYEVSVDGVVVDRFDMDAVGTGKFAGSTYHFVTLPEEYAEKFVTITLHRTESLAGRAIKTPYIGAHEDMEAMLLHDNFFAVTCGFFLVIFGLCFLFLTLLFLNRVPELKPQMVGSLLCTALGVLLITNDHIAFLFMDADTATVLDYLAIYSLLPITFLLMDVLRIEHRVPVKLYKGFEWLTLVMPVVFCLLHLLNIVHMNRFLFFYYVVVAVGVGIMVVEVSHNFREKKLSPSGNVSVFGLCSLIVCLLLNMLCFVLWRIGVPFIERETGRNFLPLGAMIYAASQIVNYLSFISESGSRQKDYASLQNIAYADALTGLANRARADKVFDELNRSREDYCLVSVDVNGLKDTNDRLGHLEGDRLLKEYAQALKANFGNEELCARMGGDEFLVVMKRTNADGFGVRLRRLYNDLDEMNEKDKTLFRSAAIGYAFRHECHGGDAHKVYLLADERMFENKREQHVRYRIKERN